MKKIYTEFEVHNAMLNDEFESLKRNAIRSNIENYIIKIKNSDEYGSIFEKKIAFELHEKRYFIGDKLYEKIELEPISINTVEFTPKLAPFSKSFKYSFKERLKILFTGRK